MNQNRENKGRVPKKFSSSGWTALNGPTEEEQEGSTKNGKNEAKPIAAPNSPGGDAEIDFPAQSSFSGEDSDMDLLEEFLLAGDDDREIDLVQESFPPVGSSSPPAGARRITSSIKRSQGTITDAFQQNALLSSSPLRPYAPPVPNPFTSNPPPMNLPTMNASPSGKDANPLMVSLDPPKLRIQGPSRNGRVPKSRIRDGIPGSGSPTGFTRPLRELRPKPAVLTSPNPLTAYAYLQKEHNSTPLQYKSPYLSGGPGFINGYEGGLCPITLWPRASRDSLVAGGGSSSGESSEQKLPEGKDRGEMEAPWVGSREARLLRLGRSPSEYSLPRLRKRAKREKDQETMDVDQDSL